MSGTITSDKSATQAPSNDPKASPAKADRLPADLPATDALALLTSGKIPQEVYLDYLARSQAAALEAATAAAAAKAAKPNGQGKRSCALTSRDEFMSQAEPLELTIAGIDGVAAVKAFKPDDRGQGSLGWYYGGKITIRSCGKLLTVQVGLNMTVIGSKELPSHKGPKGPNGQ